MRRSTPPLTWFRSFEAAARNLSFTAAADEIGLTQSAVSQQVKSLESRLGVPLFLRKPRSLALTDEGRKLLPQVATALGSLAAATETFDRGIDTKVLTVTTSVSVAQWCISPRLSDFTQKHPNISVRLLSAVWPDDFQTSQADVEIRFGTAAQAGEDATSLGPNRLVAVKSPRLEGGLKDLPLIEVVGTSTGWNAWQKQFSTLRKPVIFADTYGLALQLAEDGNGVTLTSEFLAATALSTGALEQIGDGFIEAKEGYFLSFNTKADGASTFADWIKESMADLACS
ncbi:LysR family transcriptional regulator [Octadecabacter sp. CECT 8868]|uniref:LysR family transcriptional regulator n=1 Tax=Octadecabacter algicola TaxID=2909342 RepID=UPI001F3B04C4|nr:LysR family transcriptional regulator [Octadecabacter algicola]MCF2904270.1 LysR family transcriptional regulator [Octadecabacter algicola]